MYRLSEKMILKFMKDCSIKVRDLLDMGKEEALKSLAEWDTEM